MTTEQSWARGPWPVLHLPLGLLPARRITPARRQVTLLLALWCPPEHFGGHGCDGFQVGGDGAQLQPQHDQSHDYRPDHDDEQLALQTDRGG